MSMAGRNHRGAMLALLVALAAGSTPARAEDQPASPDSPAAVPVAALNAGLTALEKSAAKPFAARYAQFGAVVDEAFNLPEILHKVVGPKWDEFSDGERKALLDVFRAYTICNYVANFNADSGDRFVVLPDVRVIGPNTVVPTEIAPKTGEPVRIDYVMRPFGITWQAIDVLQAGTISQAAVQRSDFRATIEEGGAAKLTDSLREKVRTLSGGSITP